MTSPAIDPSLQLFGGAIIRSGGSPLGGPAAHRHRLALLALLAASSGPVSRDKAIAMLWPERDTEGGRNLLKVAVHELRKVLGDAAIISTGDALSFDGAVIPCDVIRFNAALAAGDRAAAAAAYSGPFLDGFHLKDTPELERWIESQRHRFATAYTAALEHLAVADEHRGDARGAVVWWRKLAAEDPLRVDVAMRLMRALDESGDRAAAIRHAEIHAELRHRDFGIDPDPSVAAMARDLASAPSTAITLARPAAKYEPMHAAHAAQPEETKVFTRRSLSRRALFGAAGALVVTVVAVVAIGRYVNSRFDSTLATEGADVVAVTPFRVVGADSTVNYLGQGMMEMLASRFGSEGPFTAVSSTTTPRSLDDGLSLAASLGAAQLLTGDVVASAGGIDLTASVYRVPGGNVVARATRTIPRDAEIARVADTLAAELLARIAGEPEDRIADLTRRPLSTVRPYLAAQMAYRGGRYQRAESLFATAMGADSSFALAGLGLALANSWTTINDHYGQGRDAALRGAGTLSARDRAFVNAFFGSDPALGQPKPAPAYLAAWEDVVHRWPDFAEAWYHLGDRYYHFGGLSGLGDPLDQSRNAFQRAMAIDPALSAPLHHLIEIYAARGDQEDARATGELYFARNPTVARDASAIGWELATVLRDQRWLERVRGNFGTMPLSDLARIAWVTQENGWPATDAVRALEVYDSRAGATFERETSANLRFAFALNAGQPARAVDAARSFEAQVPDQPIVALWGAYAALFGDADTTGLGAAIATLTPFATAPQSGNRDRRARQIQARCLVGYSKALQGSMGAARQDLAAVIQAIAPARTEDLVVREGRLCSTWLSAWLEATGDASDAPGLAARLDTMVLRDRIPPRMSLAAATVMSSRIRERLGDIALALAASRWREHLTGDPYFLSTQLRMEARLATLTGDHATAERADAHLQALRR